MLYNRCRNHQTSRMAKPAKRRLKVFIAQIGFYDTVVAASSQAAALRAWGTNQNLFAGGGAHETDDTQAVEAALAKPETPLRRVVGTDNPFELEPRGLPNIPDAPKKWAEDLHPKKPPKLVPRVRKPVADRSPLDAAEAALKQVDDERKQEEADLRRRQDELDATKTSSQERYVAKRQAATAAVVEARTGYRAAGGKV